MDDRLFHQQIASHALFLPLILISDLLAPNKRHFGGAVFYADATSSLPQISLISLKSAYAFSRADGF